MAATSSSSSSDSSLAAVVASGDRRASLEAIRDKLVAELAETSGFHAGPLAKELRDVIREIHTLPIPGVRRVDELAARRAGRRQASGL